MWLRLMACTIVALLIVVALVGNILIIVYFRRCKTLRKLTVSPLIQQLSICGICMSCVDVITVVGLAIGQHPANYFPILCNIHFLFGSMSYPVSYWTIAAIALLLLLKAKARFEVDKTVLLLMLAAPWIFILPGQAPAWLTINQNIWPGHSLIPSRNFFCELTGSLSQLVEVIVYVLGGVLPICLCVTFYSIILCTARSYDAQAEVTRSVFFIFLVMLFTSLPYIVLLMFHPNIPEFVSFLITALGISSNTFNIFIYGLSCKTFRQAIDSDLEKLLLPGKNREESVRNREESDRNRRMNCCGIQSETDENGRFEEIVELRENDN